MPSASRQHESIPSRRERPASAGQETSTAGARVLAAVVTPITARQQMLRVVLTTAVFAGLDFLWLGVFMNNFYKTELGPLARLSGANFAPVWWAAFSVYGLLVLGLVVLVLPRADGRPLRALGFGAVLGLVCYGTYDFTAYAVLTGWSLRMTLVDLAWGAVVCGVSAAAVTAIEARLTAAPGSGPGARQRPARA